VSVAKYHCFGNGTWALWATGGGGVAGLTVESVTLLDFLRIAPVLLDAGFVAETVPDGTVFAPGEEFDKTWTLRNTGESSWGEFDAALDHRLEFVGGTPMTDLTSVPIPGPVAPGADVVFTVPMTAPDQPGTYRSEWRMTRDSGAGGFGITVWVEIVVETDG
jgi:hypothetical protein